MNQRSYSLEGAEHLTPSDCQSMRRLVTMLHDTWVIASSDTLGPEGRAAVTYDKNNLLKLIDDTEKDLTNPNK